MSPSLSELLKLSAGERAELAMALWESLSEAEALETRGWYEGWRPGRGAEFRAALDETIERIADNPVQVDWSEERHGGRP